MTLVRSAYPVVAGGGGGGTPTNMVTTDTAQTISGDKTFSGRVGLNGLLTKVKHAILTGADDVVGLVVRRNSATQTADLAQVQDDAGGNFIRVKSNGELVARVFSFSGTPIGSSAVFMQPDSAQTATSVVLVPPSSGGPTNLLEARNPAGTPRTRITKDGDLYDALGRITASVQYAVKSTDQTLSASTALTDITDLSFAIEANAVYEIGFDLAYDGPTTGDIKIAVSGPAGCSAYGILRGLNAGAANEAGGHVTRNMWGTMGVGITFGAFGVGSRAVTGCASMRVENGATAGTVKLQFAQDVSDAGVLTLQAKSNLRYRRVS